MNVATEWFYRRLFLYRSHQRTHLFFYHRYCVTMCVYIGLLQPQCERVAIEALQLCTLLLPPASRRKLQLLMRMMSRISQNVDMPRLHPAIGTRTLVGNKTDAIWNLQTNRHICSPVTLNYFQGINDISSLIFHFLFALIIVFVLVFTCVPFSRPVFLLFSFRWFTRFQAASWAALWSVIWTSCWLPDWCHF